MRLFSAYRRHGRSNILDANLIHDVGGEPLAAPGNSPGYTNNNGLVGSIPSYTLDHSRAAHVSDVAFFSIDTMAMRLAKSEPPRPPTAGCPSKSSANIGRFLPFRRLSTQAFTLFAVSILSLCSCEKKPEAKESNQSPGAGQTPPALPTPPLPPRRSAIWKEFNSERALDTAKTILRFGQRISGTEPLNQLRPYIIGELKRSGWQAEEQRFTEQTPTGRQVEFCSLVAHSGRLPVITPRLIVIAHFDTLDLGIANDLGATDGAANTAILVEIGRTLAVDPRLASHIELLFLDGHMPFRQIGPHDGLFGSRFYTQALRINQHTKDVRAAISLENLGERDATLAYPPNCDSGLIEQFRSGAEALGVKLEPGSRPLLLDHVPFQETGIPAIALFDANSPILNTADDTGDHLGSEALAKAGYLVLYILSKQITDQR